ncbi:MAG TPA: hypothetical protein VHE55_09800 [Fimbriimonadaceae bacterium]|nr:hypothetical protein [Fimbriimonadaceae bacterium]
MSARKLVYRLMVLGPAMFLIGLAVNARSIRTDFEFVANDPHTEQKIQAYVPYLRAATVTLAPKHRASADETRRIAELWVDGAQRGDLKPLTPIAYDDTSSDGAKSEIFDVRSRLVGRLLNRIPTLVESRDLHQAVDDAILAIRLDSILKYSDFVSLFNCATEQRRAIQHLEPIVDNLAPADKEAIRKVLVLLDPCPHTVDIMMTRSKDLFLAWRNQRGFPPLSIEDTQLLSDVPAAIDNGNAVAMKELRERIFASKDDHVPAFCSSLRLGTSAQSLLDEETKKIRELLK